MTAAATAPATALQLPPEGKAALRAGVVGNWIDNIHVFLPLTALAPAMLVLAGPAAAASTGALIVIAMLLGRPIGGVVFGRIADRLGRTRTTRIAIAGTALCALAIAATPTHEILGAGTIGLILALRFLCGIFVAGEYSAAIPLAMEWSAPRRRGLMSGLILSMAPWAQATIAFSVAGLLALIGPEAYAAWGWRLLFVLGALLSVGMLVYYSRQVTDAPVFHRSRQRAAAAERAEQTEPPEGLAGRGAPSQKPGLRQLLAGRWARAFWQVFVLMTGLWLLTNTTVLLLTDRLATDSPLDPTAVPVVMGIASVAQAVVMALAGHLSTRAGRRRVFVLWGVAAGVAGPLVWWLAVHSPTLATAAACAAVLQVITVSAYGPVSAYLSERFPTEVRSTGYGSGYSLSLIIPALYPFYLPALEAGFGRDGSVMALVVLGGVLLVLGAALGPRLAPRDLDGDLDEVAAGAVRTDLGRTERGR
ncbi:MFS transporter [Citricoccus sp. I39-566]|uniref:MFS transporter n=1 Tax=Citricoccus sp. I39-566 TaxID=3073268 RepID=UPI00286ACFBE|nr:MFS transporter [Citricoccus sp. I39-566]WMY79110.1 MFS transporter [Citricoccus sp. I39-566]